MPSIAPNQGWAVMGMGRAALQRWGIMGRRSCTSLIRVNKSLMLIMLIMLMLTCTCCYAHHMRTLWNLPRRVARRHHGNVWMEQ